MANFGWIKVHCIKDCITVSSSNDEAIAGVVYYTDYYSDENSFISIETENKKWVGLFNREFFLTEVQYREHIINKILNND